MAVVIILAIVIGVIVYKYKKAQEARAALGPSQAQNVQNNPPQNQNYNYNPNPYNQGNQNPNPYFNQQQNYVNPGY